MSIDDLLLGLTLASALGSGLIGGVFFAFSSFVMRALARLSARQGIATMQSINVVVINPWFMTPFAGTAIACLAVVVLALFDWRDPDSGLQLLGSGLYLAGTFLVTIAFNVPRNNALDAVKPDSAGGSTYWERFVTEWTAWNTVRTVAALLASASLTIALIID